MRPVTPHGGLTRAEEELLSMVAEGKPIKAIAAARRTAAGSRRRARSRRSSSSWPRACRPATQGALQRLRMLHQAIVDREEQGETLSRLLPGGLAEKLRQRTAGEIGETERVERDRADERHPVLLHHRRARRPEPARRPAEHAPGRDEPRHPRRGRHGDAVRRRRRDGGLRRAVPAGGPRRPGGGRRRGDARAAGRDQRPVGRPRGCRPSASASGCRPARPRPRCSAPRSGWSTPWSATR